MASSRRLRMFLSTAATFLLVASSLAPASAARVLPDTSTSMVTTPSPTQTQGNSLLSGTLVETSRPDWSTIFGLGEGLPCTGSECVYCPDVTGYTGSRFTGSVCSKTYPVAKTQGVLKGSDGSFPGLSKTDTFGLGRDVAERSTGDVVGTVFAYMQEILDDHVYDKLDPNMYLMATNNPTAGGTTLPVSHLDIIRSWFDLHFEGKKPTVEIFDITFVMSAALYPTIDGLSFVVRAETDTEVVTFKADWVRAGPFPGEFDDKWTLNRVSNVILTAKS